MRVSVTSGVYAIKNTVTGRTYVGSSDNIEARWRGWIADLKKGKAHSLALQADWDTLGESTFTWQVLEEVAGGIRERNRVEQGWMDRYSPLLYNQVRAYPPLPQRSKSRQKQVVEPMTVCPQCGGSFEQRQYGRRAVWCSDACRVAAFRQRRAAEQAINAERQQQAEAV